MKIEAFQEVTLIEALESMLDAPGLVFGPGVTMGPEVSKEVLDNVKNKLDYKISELNIENLHTQLDSLKLANEQLYQNFYNEYIKELESIIAHPNVGHLVRTKWSMCISLTKDRIFERELSNHLDKTPTSKAVFIVDNPCIQPVSRSLPIYKLFGYYLNSTAENGVSLSESQILSRKLVWPNLLLTATDYLKAGTLVFIGADEFESVKELLSIILSLKPPHPSRLVFLKGDPVLENPTIISLLKRFSSVKVINANIREFANAISARPPLQTSFQFFSQAGGAGEFVKFSNIVSVVPEHEIDEVKFNNHRLSIIDALFRPTTLDWRPFQFGLDIERDITKDLEKSILLSMRYPKGNAISNSILVRGDAGVGKTTTLKRVAHNLSKRGVTVLWCHRSPVTNWGPLFKKLSDFLGELTKHSKDRKFTLIFDDPWALKINPSEMLSNFDGCVADCSFVFSFRKSDLLNVENSAFSLPGRPAEDIEIPSTLSDPELEMLSICMEKIGAAPNKIEANKVIKEVANRNANDILCSLWFCVPESNSSIKNSLQDEYFRLGECARAVELMAEGVSSSRAAKNAYEFVTVTSNLGIAMPMEVLVRAIGIDYSDFIEMNRDGAHLWGLIYAEPDPENETTVYWARNEIVVRVLLETLNGPVGHAGEFRALKSIVKGCEIESKIYRDFLISLLVRSRTKLEEILNFEQGMELYELALKSGEANDKLLELHKGVWMQHKGKDYVLTYQQFEKALKTPEYQDSEREVVTEHIHTSMASCVVQLVKEGKQNAEEGFELVTNHFQQSRNPKSLSAHQRHISANNFYEFATIQIEAGKEAETGYPALVQSLQEIENTLVTLGPNGSKSPKHAKTIAMFHDLYNKVITSIPEVDDLTAFANKLFEEKKNQVGFELLARKELSNAMKIGKGRDYNRVNDLINELLVKIENAGLKPSDRIFATRVDLIIRWRLQKPSGPIDWKSFEKDLIHLLETPLFRDDISKLFYHAVALYHLGDIETANSVFSGIRGIKAKGMMLKDVRLAFVGPEGFPKQFQCFQESTHGSIYVNVRDLGTDIPVHSDWARGSSHCYVGFTLNGPIALSEKPDDNSFLLA